MQGQLAGNVSNLRQLAGNALAGIIILIRCPVRYHFYNKWCEGDIAISSCIEYAISQSVESFNPRHDIKQLKDLADEFEQKLPKGPKLSGLEEQLEIEEMDLLKKKCLHDMQALTVWKSRCDGAESSAHATLKQFHNDQHKNLKAGSEVWCDKFVKIAVWDDDNVANAIKAIQDAQKHMGTRLSCAQHDIRMVTSLNMCSPSTHKEHVLKNEIHLLSWVLSECSNNLGLVQMPVHSNYKNKLVILEKNFLERISKLPLNLDHCYSILFKNRCDGRDDRPLNYPGRFCFPGTLVDVRNSIWWGSRLREEGRCEPVPQIAGKDLLVVEDLSADALPSADTYPQGAKKYEQLGSPACLSQWESLLDGADFSEVKGVLIIILASQTANDIQAFLKLVAKSPRPLSVVALTETIEDAVWTKELIHMEVKGMLKAKTLTVAGMEPILDAPRSDQIVPYAPLPEFHLLVVPERSRNIVASPGQLLGDDKVLPKDVEVEMPLHVFKKWHLHKVHGPAFNEFMEQQQLKVISEVLTEPAAAAAPDPSKPKGKRGAGADVDDPSPSKKQNVRCDPKFIVTTSTVTQSLLYDVKIASPKTDIVKLQSRVGSKVMVVNLGASEVSLMKNMFLCGWGKGLYKLLKSDETISEQMIEFKLTSSEDMIVLNNAVMKLATVLKNEQAKNPTASICYHKVIEDPSDPNKFTLKQTHRIVVLVADVGDAPLNQTNFAAKVGSNPVPWKTHATHVLWQCRWTQKGLQAVAPRVYLSADVVLPPGSACLLDKDIFFMTCY